MDEIYLKYSKAIENIRSGVVKDLNYPSQMEILRFCEKKTGHTIPMNFSCNSCVFNLINLFKNLYDKEKNQ